MRCVAAVLAILMIVGAAPAVAVEPGERFDDDDGIEGEQALEWLADIGVVHGCDPPHNRRVCPDEILSRAQAAKVLVLLGRQQGLMAPVRPGTVDHFADDEGIWEGAAAPFIDHLADLGVVHGCDPPHNHRFCPAERLRLGQIVKMVVRAFGLEAPANYPSPWRDTDGHFFSEAARVAAYHGLVDVTDGVFDGYRKVTRAEFARLVVRVFEPGLCAGDPFTAGDEARLERDHPRVSVTAYAFDLASGCAYEMNPEARNQTASVFKVMVMGGALLEAQTRGRVPTATEMTWLEPMITMSANSPVRELWHSFGGSPWFTRQAAVFGLDETTVLGDRGEMWGRTLTSAHDQADLLRQVLLGEWGPLEPAGRRVSHDLMTSVVPSQTWGVTQGVPATWTVAQKNGFAGGTANSVGVVYDPDGVAVYVVAILTIGWPVWQDGVATVEEIGGWVAEALAG